VLVGSSSLLIRRHQRARCQAETPLIDLFRFAEPALTIRPGYAKLKIAPRQANPIMCSKRAKDLISVCIKNGDSLKYREYTKPTSVIVP
jgi:hypothetical protein